MLLSTIALWLLIPCIFQVMLPMYSSTSQTISLPPCWFHASFNSMPIATNSVYISRNDIHVQFQEKVAHGQSLCHCVDVMLVSHISTQWLLKLVPYVFQLTSTLYISAPSNLHSIGSSYRDTLSRSFYLNRIRCRRQFPVPQSAAAQSQFSCCVLFWKAVRVLFGCCWLTP